MIRTLGFCTTCTENGSRDTHLVGNHTNQCLSHGTGHDHRTNWSSDVSASPHSSSGSPFASRVPIFPDRSRSVCRRSPIGVRAARPYSFVRLALSTLDSAAFSMSMAHRCPRFHIARSCHTGSCSFVGCAFAVMMNAVRSGRAVAEKS